MGGFSTTLLSFIMSLVMVFNTLPLGSMIENAATINKKELAEERVQQLADYLDAAMQYDLGVFYVTEPNDEYGGDMYESLEEVPDGVDYFELDLSSINGFMDYCERVIAGEVDLGGDYNGIDFTRLSDKRLGDDNALELVYDIIAFVNDNQDIVRKLIKAEFDYGKLEYISPDIFSPTGVLSSFNLYEVFMQMIGAYGKDVVIDTDDDGTFRLERRYKEYEGEPCEHEGQGYHYPSDGWYGEPIYDENGNYIGSKNYREHRIPLTETEKAAYNADGYLINCYKDIIKYVVKGFGFTDEELENFADGTDLASNSTYAAIPALINEFASLSTNSYGDTIMHEIRQFFIAAYGVRDIKAGFNKGDIRLTGIGSDMEEYKTLLAYYNENYKDGDYALFDLELTVDGTAYKMFEASYKDDGSLVFYPYEETVTGKEINSVINGLFDMHFGTVADDVVFEGHKNETIVAEDGNTYYIDGEGVAYKLTGNYFNSTREVKAEDIAALTADDIVIDGDVVTVVDNSLAELSKVERVYYKDGYYYCEFNNGSWKCYSDEANDPFYVELNNSLKNLVSKVNPYFVYNVGMFDFLAKAEELGSSILDQFNDVSATIINLGLTEEAKAELNWVAGSNENLGDNLVKYIRFIANNLLNDNLTAEIKNMIDAVLNEDYKKTFKALSNLYDIDYYNSESFTFEKFFLDAFIATFVEINEGALFNDFVLPENIDSIEGLLAYMIAYAGDEIIEGFNYVNRFVENGALKSKSDEEWIDEIFDLFTELFLRVWAKESPVSNVVFTTEEINAYLAEGWGCEEFLDELFDRFYIFLEGAVEVCDGLQCNLGVLDGNGPWYKVSKYLNALLPVAIFNDCEKKYGNELIEFDLGVFLKEGLLANALDVDFAGLFNIFAVNESGANPFFGNNVTKGVVIAIQNFINAILPGAIRDENIKSFDQLISNDNLAEVVVQMIASLNDRKEMIAPLIILWLEAAGFFQDMPLFDKESKFGYLLREDEQGTFASVEMYFGEDKSVIEIPETLGGYEVRDYNMYYYVDEGEEVPVIKLPKTLRYISEDSYSLENVMFDVDKDNPYYESYDDVLFTKGLTDIIAYPRYKTDSTFIVPGTVKTVYAETFQNNTYLTSLVIKEGVSSIKSGYSNSWYRFNYNLTDIYVPTSVEYIYLEAFNYWSSSYNALTFYGRPDSYVKQFYDDNESKWNNEWSNNREVLFEEYYSDELFITLKTEKEAVKSNIYCYGYASSDARIYVYDGDKLIGNNEQFKGNKYSKWEANVHLYKPVDSGSDHIIRAKVVDADGNEVWSEPITVHYEKGAVVFKEFKISHANYYSATVTSDNINRIHNMTWIPGYPAKASFRVKLANSKNLVALYLVDTKSSRGTNRIELSNAGDNTWIGEYEYYGNDYPGVFTLEGVYKKSGETKQIGEAIRINFLIDPSGNVYEFLTNNPLEGVTATVCYKDENGNAVAWEDAEYSNQVNPLITDAGGNFKWDVPEGEWCVKFEKEGYKSIQTPWYTIPPEVKDLRVFMQTTKEPEVVEAYFDGYNTIVEFDQYVTSYEVFDDNGMGLYAYTNDYNYGLTDSGTYSPEYNEYGYMDYNYETTKGMKSIVVNGYQDKIIIRNLSNYAGIVVDEITVEPTTETYTLNVTSDDDDIVIGDVFNVSVEVTDSQGNPATGDVAVDFDTTAIFDDEIDLDDNDVVDVTSVIPETLELDENGKADIQLIAGFTGESNITFKFAGSSQNEVITVNRISTNHVHNYKTERLDSTCTTEGYEYTGCDCGDGSSVTIPTKPHTHEKIVDDDAKLSDATCRAPAVYRYSCGECGLLYYGEDDTFTHGNALGHTQAEPYKENETANGYDLITKCQVCLRILKEETVVISTDCLHENQEPISAIKPTCTADGLTEGAYCVDCGETIVEQEADPQLGHSFGGWYVATEATCKDDGVKKNECKRDGCGFVDTATIPKNEEHTLVKVDGKPATCTEPGLEDGEMCSVCEKITVAQAFIPALKHSFTKYEIVEESKCGVEGKEVAVCDRDGCGAKDEKAIAALEHKDADGDYKCDLDCGYEFDKSEEPTPDVPDTPDEPTEDEICDDCGSAHETQIDDYICLIISFFKLLFSFIDAVK